MPGRVGRAWVIYFAYRSTEYLLVKFSFLLHACTDKQSLRLAVTSNMMSFGISTDDIKVVPQYFFAENFTLFNLCFPFFYHQCTLHLFSLWRRIELKISSWQKHHHRTIIETQFPQEHRSRGYLESYCICRILLEYGRS